MLKKRAIIILLVSILSMGLISCDNSKKVESNNKEVNSYEKTEKILGTVVSGAVIEEAFNLTIILRNAGLFQRRSRSFCSKVPDIREIGFDFLSSSTNSYE